jgi:hypothetical protein
MYPIERYMKTLKGYVRNMARPEASMAEGYVKEECIGFVTEYLKGLTLCTGGSGMPMKSTVMWRRHSRVQANHT